MRLRAIAFALTAFAAVTAAAWMLAVLAVEHVERETLAGLEGALAAAGQEWVDLGTDGLIVNISGQAPDETGRFRTLEIARQVVNMRRIVDRMIIARANDHTAPAFALELLRNEDDISLIGLVPEAAGRDVISVGLAAAGLPALVTDMLETAAYHPPVGWVESLRFGMTSLADLPRAKISIVPGSVRIVAAFDSSEALAAAEQRLRGAVPAGVALDLELSAPRPVIAPFRAKYVLNQGVGSLLACTAESADDMAAIVAAAGRDVTEEPPECAIGLGAPSPDWAKAVVMGIDAVGDLGGGTFEIVDLDAVLVGTAEASLARLNVIAERLDAELPVIYSVSVRMPPSTESASDAMEEYAPRFQASLLPDGSVRLSGAVHDATSQTAIRGFAEALFGHDRVMNTTFLDPAVPEGWPGRILAGIEALSLLKEGALTVTPDEVIVIGSGLAEAAADDVEAHFRAKLDGIAVIDVHFDAVAAEDGVRPRPETCADEIEAILADEMILFAPGSAEIDAQSLDVIDAISSVLHGCVGIRFEIGGHTDSQGRAGMNLQLSEARASAVLTALLGTDLPPIDLVSRGYGADRPVADNATEAGRALNRRIEFTLLPEDRGEGNDDFGGREIEQN